MNHQLPEFNIFPSVLFTLENNLIKFLHISPEFEHLGFSSNQTYTYSKLLNEKDFKIIEDIYNGTLKTGVVELFSKKAKTYLKLSRHSKNPDQIFGFEINELKKSEETIVNLKKYISKKQEISQALLERTKKINTNYQNIIESEQKLLEDNKRNLISSNAKFQNFINHSNDGIIIVNEKGLIEEWNSSISKITGLNVNDTKYKDILYFKNFVELDETEISNIKKRIKDYIVEKNNDSLYFRGKIKHLNGNIKNVHSSLFRINSGKTTLYGIVIRDIGDYMEIIEQAIDKTSKLANNLDEKNAELLKSEGLYFDLFNHAPDGILIGVGPGTVIDANASMLDVSGYKPEEIIGENISVLFKPEDILNQPLRYDLVLKGKKVVVDRILTRKDGSKINIEMHSKILSDGRMLAFIRDIESRKKAEIRRQESERLIKEIQKGVSARVGEHFFESMIKHIKSTTLADLVVVGKISDQNPDEIQTLFYQFEETPAVNDTFKIKGSPSEKIIENGFYYQTSNITEAFPDDITLKNHNYEGYIGVALKDSANETIGFISLLYNNKFIEIERKLSILNIFSTRIGAEIERLATYNKLESSEKKFAKVFNYSPSLIILSTLKEGIIIDANENYLKLNGLIKEDTIGKTTIELELISQEKRQELVKHLIKSKKITNHEEIYTTRNGKEIYTISSIEVIEVNDEKVILKVINDVSDLKEKEKQIKKEEEKFRNIFNNSNDLIAIMDFNYRFIQVNKTFIEESGYTHEEIPNYKALDLLKATKSNTFNQRLERLKKFESVPTIEVDFLKKSNNLVPMEINSRAIIYYDKPAILSIIRDITERKDMERKLLDTIISTEEKEREKFASDLHDELGPFLSGIKLYINELADDEILPEQRKELTDYLKEMVDEAVQKTRNISNQLMPNILLDYGLIKAVQSFCNKIDHVQQLNIQLKTNLNEERFPQTLEVVFYRIIIELINNTLKHANASSIGIKITQENNFLKFVYTDNGIGFDLIESYESRKGLGLTSLLNRLKSIKGQYDFISKPNKGIKFTIKAGIE